MFFFVTVVIYRKATSTHCLFFPSSFLVLQWLVQETRADPAGVRAAERVCHGGIIIGVCVFVYPVGAIV